MNKINIPSAEIGVTRVFSLSMPASEARNLREDPQAQQRALGLDTLVPKGVEVFPLTDLGDLGLAGYLREGVDAKEAELKRDAARLNAIDGWVMLVHSSAFGGEPATLTPSTALTLIGTYGQVRPDTPAVDLQSDAAKPYTGAPDIEPVPVPPRGRGQAVIVAALVALIALALFWMLG